MAPRKKAKLAAAAADTEEQLSVTVPKKMVWTPAMETVMLQLLYHRVQQMQKEPHGTFTGFAAK